MCGLVSWCGWVSGWVELCGHGEWRKVGGGEVGGLLVGCVLLHLYKIFLNLYLSILQKYKWLHFYKTNTAPN